MLPDRIADLARRATERWWPHGWWAAVAALVALVALWAFLEAADEVLEGSTQRADEAILLALREPGDTHDPLGPAWLEGAVRDITALGSTAVLSLLSLAALAYLLLTRDRWAAGLLAVSVGGAMLLSRLLKAFVDRPRPDIVAHGMETYGASFPSGHSMLSTAVYLTVAVLLARVQPRHGLRVYYLAVAAFLALAVGISRIYLGVHWPTDVLAGWCAGTAWALSCWLVAEALGRRRAAAV